MLLKTVHIVLFLWGFVSIMVLGAVIGTVEPAEGRAVQVLALVLGAVLVLGFLFIDGRRGVTRGSKGLPPTWTAQESQIFMHAAEDVWAAIRPAENPGLVGEDLEHAFTVPGTGGGIGELQCFIRRDRSMSMVQVVSEESGRSATTKVVVPPELGVMQTYRLEPTAGGGCSLTMGIVLEVPATATAEWLKDYEETWRAQTRQFLTRLTAVLANE